MKRSTWHLIVDVLLGLSGLALLSTGLLMEFVLPPHSRQAAVWGLTRHEWGDLHFWLAVGLLAVLLVHLVLNWGWVCSVVTRLCGGAAKQSLRRKQITGLAALAVLVLAVAGFLGAAAMSKQPDPGGPETAEHALFEGYGWGAGRGR